MQQAITDHIRRFFKYSCYSKTTTLRSSCQAITEEAANQWMKQALAKGKILDVVDRLNGPHPNPDPPDFKEEEGVRNGPSAMALITPSTSPDNGGESD